jgi:hypothetical protein
MSESHAPHERSWWSTRQQLVVVTSDEPDAAATWPDHLDRLMESVRDVLDEWRDTGPYPEQPELAPFDATIERMRRALFALRQYEVPS